MQSVVVAALSKTTEILEIIILIVVIGLLVAVLVLYSRRNKPAKAKAAPAPQTYYGDLATAQGPATTQTNQGFAQSPDPFAGFGGAPAQPVQVAAPPPPPQPVAPAGPVPGTPAGWLPDPAGAPNTLRYWDGNAWTQHVAARS
jgi:hypothetical protein